MIHPLTTNPENTVGICTAEIPQEEYVGLFSASRLKEFAELILKVYGDEHVFLFSHSVVKAGVSGRILAASKEFQDTKFICVCGAEDSEDILKQGD